MSIQSRGDAKRLNRNPLRKIHAGWVVFLAAFLLMMVGIEAIDTTRLGAATRQLLLGGVGMMGAFFIVFVPQKRLRQASWWLYIMALILLIFL